ncbi:MAG: tetratricopeptide repeat protein [Flavobacteriales bacterium]|nr:tetratricopeptide repeat protein [Flavobacteriales bacterium]
MKKLGLLAVVAFLATSTFAQGKYGADSVQCVQNLSLYRDYYKQKLYDDAFTYWKVVYEICPKSSERMYADGISLMGRKIKKTKVKEEKLALVDELLVIYDRRIDNFGKKGYVLGRKGTDQLRYKSKQPELAFATLEESINERGNKSEAGTLVSYMNASVLMEKAEKLTKEELVTVFSKVSGVLAFNITKGGKSQQYYIKAQESINNVASPYLSCEILEKMANEGFEKNKSDAAWMERTANILDKKGCTDAPIFFTIAKELHSSSPSAVSAEKMGIMSLKTKKYADAEKFFKQAIELAQDETKKADYYIELAQSQSSMKRYGAARTNARKAASLKSNYGLPYLMIGDMIIGSSSCGGEDACKQKAIYWLAVDYFNKAKSVDPSVTGKANGKIAIYKKYFPTKEDCFFGGTKAGDSVALGCWIGESTKARF